MTEFRLRPWRESDAVSLAHYANNAAIAANLRDVFPHPYTLPDAEAYIRGCIEAEDSQLCRAIVVDSEAVGSIGIFPKTDVYRRSAEIGYWLGEPFWGQGIMTAAVEQICRTAFQSFDIVRIEAAIFAANISSKRVLEKSGFTLEGTLRRSIWKNGVFSDTLLYALLKEADL